MLTIDGKGKETVDAGMYLANCVLTLSACLRVETRYLKEATVPVRQVEESDSAVN